MKTKLVVKTTYDQSIRKMPRPANILIETFFEQNASNQIVCRNGNCNGKILSKHGGNLERHLKVLHTQLYANYITQKSSAQNKNCSNKMRITIEVNKKNIRGIHKSPHNFATPRNFVPHKIKRQILYESCQILRGTILRPYFAPHL